MKQYIAFMCFLFFFQQGFSQITLSHNIENTPIDIGWKSCESDEGWGRVFNLEDFGIAKNEQFLIYSGEVGITKSYGEARVGFNVYSVDANFPESRPVYIGGDGFKSIPEINAPEVVQFEFSPIVVPAGVQRILVVVSKSEEIYNPNSNEMEISGSATDTGKSYFKGCRKYYDYLETKDLEVPVPNANFYINVTGETHQASNFGTDVTLSHNFCEPVIQTMNHSCTTSFTFFGRDYYMEDYEISSNEELIINSGQVAFSYVDWGATAQFNIYKIDENFPDSFSQTDLIGSSQEYVLPILLYKSAEIIDLKFDVPIVVPPDVTRILVEVKKGLTGDVSGLAHVAGTLIDDGATSWYRGCAAGTDYINTDNFNRFYGWPGKDYNFYINVAGTVNHVLNSFEMNMSKTCSQFLMEFSLTNETNITSVNWDFGDPNSGSANNSSNISPFHDFSEKGTYTITATVLGKDGTTEIISETVDVNEPPKAYGAEDVVACETTKGTGEAFFNLSVLKDQIIGNQTEVVVSFINGLGEEFDHIPAFYTNSTKNRERVTVKVKSKHDLCCFSETSFDLIVIPKYDLSDMEPVYGCETDTAGFATFDLTELHDEFLSNGYESTFYYNDGTVISPNDLNNIQNRVQNEDIIYVEIESEVTNCRNDGSFKIKVVTAPIAHALNDIIGCDDNNDGFSEYFDTSQIETTVLNGQINMEVLYFDQHGNELTYALESPYTNRIHDEEIITVRVINPETNCFDETTVRLKTTSKPQINTLEPFYSCDIGNGIGVFDTSTIETLLIGNQVGLKLTFYDSDGSIVANSFPATFKNKTAWEEEITVIAETESNSNCFSETTLVFRVNEIPEIQLEDSYVLCALEPSKHITAIGAYDSWEWRNETGALMSNSSEIDLSVEGNYTLTVTKDSNGITCENSKTFTFSRSELPEIQDVKVEDLSENNNNIIIEASGDGEFEYSIDGVNFYETNEFNGLQGGIYTAEVRDKKGCGSSLKEFVIVDYPKFFTPNNDGFNDTWNVFGIEKFPDAVIQIFDRFGKHLWTLKYGDEGWDGTYNGTVMNATDYWFTVDLDGERQFKGHFSLVR